jgi:NTP pyrophosphatase (non-canonical NTP hydrolase)
VTTPPEPRMAETLDEHEDSHFKVEGDKHKLGPTRHYFSAIFAGLKTAEQYAEEMRAALLAAEQRAVEAERESPSRMLAEFHAAVSHPETDGLWLRRTLHDEEHAELVEALELGDRGQIARELADVVYVAFGTACAAGINLDAALAEVHRANMHKATAGIRRDDGKVIKPPDFKPPDMSAALAPHKAAEEEE